MLSTYRVELQPSRVCSMHASHVRWIPTGSRGRLCNVDHAASLHYLLRRLHPEDLKQP